MAHALAVSSQSSSERALKMATYVLLFVIFLIPTIHANIEHGREGIIDHLSNGMQFAKDFLGSESIAQKVAEFVVQAFQNANAPNFKPTRRQPVNDAYADHTSNEEKIEKRPNLNMNEGYSPMSPLRHLVKLFGLQPNQISAVAVNALVFVAQMISTFLAGPRRPGRSHNSEDPTSWILNKNSRALQDLIKHAQNESLPDAIEDLIKQQGSEEETSCIRLLVCKITPFVTKMQRAVFGNETLDNSENIRGSATFYRHLPSNDEINDRSEVCERKHKDCNLNE